jgi:hypothetical protein
MVVAVFLGLGTANLVLGTACFVLPLIFFHSDSSSTGGAGSLFGGLFMLGFSVPLVIVSLPYVFSGYWVLRHNNAAR